MFDARDIEAVTAAVTRKWTKQRKAEERGNRSRESRGYIYSNRINFTDIADAILPAAYQHASGEGKYTVAKRQFFYSARDPFQERARRPLKYPYFANTLLVQYMNRHPDETASWKVTADPRGTLLIPNAGHPVRIPVGTLHIDDYLRKCAEPWEPLDIDARLDIEWPSLAAGHRYQAVLYIEKEGFGPLLEEARIAERFDLAVISCKGQSVVAARKFADHVCRVGGGVPLFTVHDFDKQGFEIAQRVTTVSDWAMTYDRVTYEFQNEIDVTDFGLRLEDVEKYKLTGEACKFEGNFAIDSVATEEEQEFLRRGCRVELNELTAPQFLEWVEGNLTKHLRGRRLIPTDNILADAYRRGLAIARINQAIEDAVEAAVKEAEDAEIPQGLRRAIRRALKGSAGAWDTALYHIAQKAVFEGDESDV